MTDIPSLVAQIRELLPKVYEGQWSVERYEEDGMTFGLIVSEDQTIIAEVRGALDSCGNGDNANWLALLNPVTVTALLDRIEELEQSRDVAQGIHDRLRESSYKITAEWKARAEAAESKLAEARADALEAQVNEDRHFFLKAKAAEDRVAKLEKELERQCDTIAFVINHVTLPDSWYEKFQCELENARAALEDKRGEQNDGNT